MRRPPAQHGSAGPADCGVLAPPEQQPAPARRRRRAGRRSATPMPTLPLPTQACVRLMQVVVDDEGEQREQQVPVAGAARVGGRQADAQQQQVGGAEHQAEAPGQLALVARRRPPQQVERAPARGGSVVGARQRALAGQHAVAARSATASSRRCVESCSLRWPRSSTQEAVVADVLDAGRCAAEVTDSRVGCVVRMKTLRPVRAVGRVALDEEHAAAVARGLELARRDARQVGALLEALAQFDAALVLPGPDEQHQQADDEQHRPARRAAPGARSASGRRRWRTRSPSRCRGTCGRASRRPRRTATAPASSADGRARCSRAAARRPAARPAPWRPGPACGSA